jgi:hypothetical protein
MFLTANSLAIQYGIDDQIAKFYVDREPPKDNLYWKDKLLFLRPQPGYIFLPLITDLYYRSGIPKEILLGETFVQVLEDIGHFSAEQESGLISTAETVSKCIEVVKARVKDERFLSELINYYKGAGNRISPLLTPFKSLHRGDFFLFSLCLLDIDMEKQFELTKTWFALISTLLLLDDAEDYLDDKEKGEENAFIESGSNQEGFERIKALLADNFHYLAKINFSLADALHRKFAAIADKPGIKEYLTA